MIFQEDHVLPKFIVHLEHVESSVPEPVTSSPTSKVDDWSVDQVISWLGSLQLASDYSEIIKKENINGPVLKTMTKDDWRELGVTKFGDLRLLTANTENLLKK